MKLESDAQLLRIFIGDSDTDVQAAQEFGCTFVGIANEMNEWREGENYFPVLASLENLDPKTFGS